jgi:hypothetical protein
MIFLLSLDDCDMVCIQESIKDMIHVQMDRLILSPHIV